MNTAIRFVVIIFSALLMACSPGNGKTETIISVKTTSGDLKIKLYNETPLHRDNFIKLVNSGFYDGISFHRVINGFMIQAGDGMTKKGASIRQDDTLNTYTIASEFNKNLYHKKGALAAAREGSDTNPLMNSSGTQFYIVQGKILSEEELAAAEQQANSNISRAYFIKFLKEISDSLSRAGQNLSSGELQELTTLRLYDFLDGYGEYKMTENQRKDYTTIGGVPRLDGTYTVFGEVIEGIETIDKIAAAPTDSGDRPVNDIKILKMKVLK
jgi:peptidylprolyl isomerase